MWKKLPLAAIVGVLLLALPAGAPAHASGGQGPEAATPPKLCEIAVRAAERARNLPLHLLQAIAFVESGRMSARHGERVAWPWTVMAEGRGRYYESKEEALAAVRGLQARGVENIDVGCMQVNLYYHGDAFASLEDAFDPVHNVAYATAFLLDLRRTSNSWTKAIKQYHSRNRERQFAYRARVYREWRALKHGVPPAPVAAAAPQPSASPQPAPVAAPGALSRPTGAGAAWPPKSYADQQRLENRMRALVMSPQL
ncbi:MAG: transglycosylase SLT domain-containing protein [Marivibrio sp.]|uniref:transglycosylase SLT domain-containing protein n=1 Tax=Marivibrio sp. TaxID=2039719 RepID=UPI0032EB9C91